MPPFTGSKNMATAKPEVVISPVAEQVGEKFQGLYKCFERRSVQWHQNPSSPKYHRTGNTSVVAAEQEVILP